MPAVKLLKKSRVADVAEFKKRSCAACTYREGQVVAWGINDFGQLGNGSTVYATSPGQVVGLEDIAVSDIAAAGWHSLAITTSGGTFSLVVCTCPSGKA